MEVKVFHGYLTYNPEYCDKCSAVNKGSNDIINWRFGRNCLIKIPKISNFNTIFLLDEQRFYYKHCHSTFSAKTSLVDFFSNNSKLSVIMYLINKDSEKYISKRNNISTNSN